mmetsp:Transcript_24579/g.66276  ORF Transcript_24579/g.66276 Transcript_24579/m.66276 type:complete len:265 (+) Transcript_24579:47-841(+)
MADAPAPMVDFKACFAEFIAMMFFVYIGCGSATFNAGSSGWVLAVALQFGVGIMVLAYATAHISGGQINCAVTFALCITGDLPWAQGGANFVCQMIGSMVGAALLSITAHGNGDLTRGQEDGDKIGGLGCNGVGDTYTQGGAFVAEFMMTALLVYVVLQTAVNKKSLGQPNIAPIPIGFAVFLAHVVLIPIDGCSINPTRSFGPAVVASAMGSTNVWDDMWVFWAAPLLGAATVAVMTIGAKRAYEPTEEVVAESELPAKDTSV